MERSKGGIIDRSTLRAFRTRFLWLSVVILGGYLPFIARNAVQGFTRVALIQAVACGIVFLCLGIQRKTESAKVLHVLAHIVLGAAMGAGFLGALVTGQGAAVSAWVLPLGPLYAAYLLNSSSAVSWTIVCLAGLFGLHYSGTVSPIAPDFVASGWKVWGSQTVTLLVVYFFGSALRRGSEQQFELLKEQSLALTEAQEKLSESYTELRRVEQARQHFVELLVHDMKNPVMGILTYAQLLAIEEDLTQEGKELAEGIQSFTFNLENRLNNILDVSRLEQEELELRSDEIDYVDLCTEVVGEFETGTGSKIVMEAPRSVPIICDPNLLRRVLENLLSNALKYSPPEEKVLVTVQIDEKNVLTRVVDRGPGIDPRYHSRIFQRFFRADNPTKQSTGLGLTLCKLAVEKHGGTIGFDSAPGKGCEFCFTLPLIAS